MSLHEILREGGEASYRIMNRLSHLIQNLDISGLGTPFPFSPASRKNSWRDWDGKSCRGRGRPCSVCSLFQLLSIRNLHLKLHECARGCICMCVCVFVCNVFLTDAPARLLQGIMPSASHTISCGLPLLPAELFLCLSLCV